MGHSKRKQIIKFNLVARAIFSIQRKNVKQNETKRTRGFWPANGLSVLDKLTKVPARSCLTMACYTRKIKERAPHTRSSLSSSRRCSIRSDREQSNRIIVIERCAAAAVATAHHPAKKNNIILMVRFPTIWLCCWPHTFHTHSASQPAVGASLARQPREASDTSSPCRQIIVLSFSRALAAIANASCTILCSNMEHYYSRMYNLFHIASANMWVH